MFTLESNISRGQISSKSYEREVKHRKHLLYKQRIAISFFISTLYMVRNTSSFCSVQCYGVFSCFCRLSVFPSLLLTCRVPAIVNGPISRCFRVVWQQRERTCSKSQPWRSSESLWPKSYTRRCRRFGGLRRFWLYVAPVVWKCLLHLFPFCRLNCLAWGLVIF